MGILAIPGARIMLFFSSWALMIFRGTIALWYYGERDPVLYADRGINIDKEVS